MKHPHFLTVLITTFSLALGSLTITKPGYTAENLDLAGESVRQIASVVIHDIIDPEVPRTEKIRRLEVLFTTNFDMEAVSRFVLGRYWRRASQEEQKGFIDAFRNLNIYTWVDRFQSYDGQKLVVGRVSRDKETGAFVKSHMTRSDNRADIPVVWRLRWRNNSWKVVDIAIEGVSMALTFRKEYAAFFSQTHTSNPKSEVTVADLTQSLSDRVDKIKDRDM